MKQIFRTFFTVVLFMCLMPEAHAYSVSDKMPLALVQYLQANKLWLTQYDVESSTEHQDLYRFFEEFIKANPDISGLVSNIFNPLEQSNSFDKLPLNYLQKIQILRYYKNVAGKSYIVDELMNGLYKKYVEISSVLISMAEVKEYAPVLRMLSQQIQMGAIKVVDLTPELRAELEAEEKEEHLHAHNKHDQNSYRINGLYSEKKKIIAIDLLRPVAESVVTLAHEIIHSSDPYIAGKKNYIKSITPYVMAKLKEKINLPRELAEKSVQALVSDVFYEMGRPDLFDLVNEISQMRKLKIEVTGRNLDEKAKNEKEEAERLALKELMEDSQIQNWMHSIISASVENEYRAYVLSLAAYHKLKSKFDILPTSTRREEFIASITKHDFAFLKSLESSINPFTRGTSLSKVFKSVQELESFKKNDSLIKQVTNLKSILEQHYLIQSEKLFNSMAQVYSEALEIIKSSDSNVKSVRNDLLPEWTEKGKFDSPTNPYTLLTAKISTSTLLQFKANLNDVLFGLKQSQEALLLMRAGILPLHNLNLGELKLLGLQRAGAPESVVPSTLDDKVRSQVLENPEVLKTLFSEQSWNPQTIKDYTAIPQVDLMRHLYQLHLAKSVFWLRNKFPLIKKNLVTLKVFGHKLAEGFYDPADLSEQRANELRNQIQSMLDNSFMSAGELAAIRDLTRDLALYYRITSENRWNELANEFQTYIETATRSMMALGVSNIQLSSLYAVADELINNLKSQIKQEYPKCAKSLYLENLTTNKTFVMGASQFRLTTICYNAQYYVLRQPGDDISTIRAHLMNGKPAISVFFEPRPIMLEPLNQN